MFRCERCGTGFNPTVAAFMEGCPRCKARDGIAARVSFKLFERSEQPIEEEESPNGGSSPGAREGWIPSLEDEAPVG
jgi:predicted  nucleic acid-binding Zn-ribbon protein